MCNNDTVHSVVPVSSWHSACPCMHGYMRPVGHRHDVFLSDVYGVHRWILTKQTFVSGATLDKGQLFRFWGQKVKDQDHSLTKEQRAKAYRLCVYI